VSRARAERQVLLGRFTEQLAHDVKNPLTALKGALQFLSVERELGRPLDAHARFVDLMIDQVARIQRSFEQYQRFARVEPELRRCSLDGVVQRVMALQAFASASSISLRGTIEPGLPECDLDEDLLAQALESVLANACDAMPDGGLISVRAAHASPPGGGVTLSVADEGAGMDARTLELACDEFYTTKAQGRGLGLHFVKRVARAHGGRLELQSQLGRGTIVSIHLPAAARAAEGTAGAAELLPQAVRSGSAAHVRSGDAELL
jgi:signal transduction histidine kinase